MQVVYKGVFDVVVVVVVVVAVAVAVIVVDDVVVNVWMKV